MDKGITIEDSLEYASLLSKRYTLALLEDNPELRQSGFLGIPPTDNWETYKAAYIDKLVKDHTKIQSSVEQIERGKKTVARAKVRIEQRKEHAKLAIERSKEAVEGAKAQIQHSKEQIERAMTQLERSIVRLERAKKELSSQQFVHIKKQIEGIQGTLAAPKKPAPPQEPTLPQGSN